MNHYNEISTLQYMGSKTRIISHICEPIRIPISVTQNRINEISASYV